MPWVSPGATPDTGDPGGDAAYPPSPTDGPGRRDGPSVGHSSCGCPGSSGGAVSAGPAASPRWATRAEVGGKTCGASASPG